MSLVWNKLKCNVVKARNVDQFLELWYSDIDIHIKKNVVREVYIRFDKYDRSHQILGDLKIKREWEVITIKKKFTCSF